MHCADIPRQRKKVTPPSIWLQNICEAFPGLQSGLKVCNPILSDVLGCRGAWGLRGMDDVRDMRREREFDGVAIGEHCDFSKGEISCK